VYGRHKLYGLLPRKIILRRSLRRNSALFCAYDCPDYSPQTL